MPTEATYLAAAVALERAASDADDLARSLPNGLSTDVLRGGALTAAVRFALGRSTAAVVTVATATRAAAALCHWRAEQCRLYAQRVERWQQADNAYGRAVRDWQALAAAHRASPSIPAPAGPPAPPGDPPVRPYPWIA